MDRPVLRNVDLDPVEVEGEQVFSLSDPSGIVEEVLLLHPGAVFIVMHFDGEHTVDEIHAKAQERFKGDTLPVNMVEDLVKQLDEYGFLESPGFILKYQSILQEFEDNPVRVSSLAGRSYPDDPKELRVFLDEQFLREGAVGEALPVKGEGPPLPGLIAPHIDLNRGGHSYSYGYRAMAAAGKPDTVIIFGVAHAAEPVPFILTRKDFETPLGVLETDKELVDRLAEVCPWNPFEFELTHRTEHSIEFQALMLAHIYGPTVKIVPILTSYYGEGTEFLDDGEHGPVQRFLEECRAIVKEGAGKVTVISGVDLAHVGRTFGDDFDIDEGIIGNVAVRDGEDLAHVERLDADAFYRSVMQDGNRRNVCGLKAIYAGLYTLQGSVTRAEKLHYDYAHDPSGGIVSFTSMALH